MFPGPLWDVLVDGPAEKVCPFRIIASHYSVMKGQRKMDVKIFKASLADANLNFVSVSASKMRDVQGI